MKNNALFLVLLLFIGSSSMANAQKRVKPSGTPATKSYDFAGFTAISIADDFKAYITHTSGKESVSIKVDDNLLPYIRVAQVGDRLEINFKDNVNFQGKEMLEAYISVNSLKELEGRGDAIIHLENELKSDRLSLRLAGDSELNGALDVKEMKATLRGDSYMKVSGEIDDLNASLRGDSMIKKYNCTVKNLDIKLNGDSECYLTVTESLSAVVRGDSILKYKGDAEVRSKKVGEDSEFSKAD